MTAAALQRFPFPFETDTYRYGTDLEPGRTVRTTAAGRWGEHIVDVGPEYRDVIAERARILAADPRRHAALPHMDEAKADALSVILAELHRARPDETELGESNRYWRNGMLGIEVSPAILSTDPLVFAASQIQEDVVLLDTRDGHLHADAGVVTFAADWSMNFDLGMSFHELHRPVPRVLDDGIVSRAEAFIGTLEPRQWVRRTNFSLGVDHRLDASVETRHEWEPARRAVADADADEVGRRLCLRVELQHLTRLAPSGAIMFLIRTHLASLDELAMVPGWAERTVAVLRELPEDMADYKGVTPLRPAVERWWFDRRDRLPR